MAYKLIWSPIALDDLHDIVLFIARDNPQRAMSFGYELISQTDELQVFPEFGRTVPEYQDQHIREIILRPYRLSTALITSEGDVRSHASGIRRGVRPRFERTRSQKSINNFPFDVRQLFSPLLEFLRCLSHPIC